MSFLDGFTIIDMASVGPAARATRILADYGMKVIKVAPVSAASGKQIAPIYHAYSGGRGSQRIRVNIKEEAGKKVIYQLAKNSDAIIESYRPGVAKRLGIGYEDLREKNSSLIYCSTSGYGQDGPYSQWAGHDINYLALGGYLAASGTDSEGLPALAGATIADSAGGGMHAAIAIIAALVQRLKSGEGAYLDVSATDGVLNLMSLFIDQYTATGEETKPGNSVLTGQYAWYRVYGTAGGGAVSVGAIEPHFFKNLCRLLDLEKYADSQYDEAAQEQMKADFQARFISKDRDYWVETLSGNDTCVAPVLSVAEVSSDQHLQARDSFNQVSYPGVKDFTQLAPIFAGMEKTQTGVSLQDGNITNTDSVLEGAGFSEADIEQLRNDGVVE